MFLFQDSIKIESKLLWESTRGIFIYFPRKEIDDTGNDRHLSLSSLPIHKKKRKGFENLSLKSICRKIEWKNK